MQFNVICHHHRKFTVLSAAIVVGYRVPQSKYKYTVWPTNKIPRSESLPESQVNVSVIKKYVRLLGQYT